MPTPNAPPPPKTIQARQLGSPYWKEGFMSSKAPQLLSRSMFKAQADGRVTVRISNPLVANYLGLPPKGTVLPGEQGDDVVLSIQPDGSIQARQGHANGGYEKATAQTMTGLLVWKPEGTAAFTLPFTE